MSKHFNEELKDLIINRKLNGESAYDLAKEYNIGASTIYKWIRLSYGSIDIKPELIDLKPLIISDLITLNINGLDIKIDSLNLNKIFKGINND